MTDWLKRKDRFAKAILIHSLQEIFKNFKLDAAKILCKQKRKRKTTYQLIKCSIPYLDSFSNNDDNNLISLDKKCLARCVWGAPVSTIRLIAKKIKIVMVLYFIMPPFFRVILPECKKQI